MESTSNAAGNAPAAKPGKGAQAEAVREVQERLGPRLEQAEQQILQVNEKVKDFVRKNPGTCLLGAAALGFLVGRWAARR